MKIVLLGDVMLGRLVNKLLMQESASYPWGNSLPIILDSDMRICNLECVLSDIGQPWTATEKIFHFRSDEKNITVLQAAKITIASIANNHVLDFEYEALDRMLKVLDANHLLHAGSGNGLQEALKPAICAIADKKVGLIAFTDNEPGWAAQPHRPGVYYVPTKVNDQRAQDLFKLVKGTRQRVDFLIVSAHWGPNWGYTPPKDHVSMGHALIDAGADVIFGHSPHIFRGIEVYNGRPILYSTGDFVDDYAVDEIERNDESFIFIIDVSPEGHMKVFLYPTCIDQFQAILAPSFRKNAILSKMDGLCKALGSHLQLESDHAVLDVE